MQKKLQVFPLEDTWYKVSKNIQGTDAKLLFALINSKELKDEDFLEIIWRQLITSFEGSRVVLPAQVYLLKSIIKELCIANKTHLLEPCINLLANSSALKFFIQSLHSLYFSNPLVVLSDDVMTQFNAISTEDERVILAIDATELDIEGFVSSERFSQIYFPTTSIMKRCQHRMFEVLNLKIAKELINRTGYDLDPDVVFSELNAVNPQAASGRSCLFELYKKAYASLKIEQLDQVLSLQFDSIHFS